MEQPHPFSSQTSFGARLQGPGAPKPCQGWKDFGCEGGAAATAAKTNAALSEVLRMDAVVPRWLGGSGRVVPRMDGGKTMENHHF